MITHYQARGRADVEAHEGLSGFEQQVEETVGVIPLHLNE